MSAEKLSSRWAKALFDEAQHSGQLDTVFADMNLLKGVLKDNKDLLLVYKSPVVPAAKKLAITQEIFKDKLHANTTRFLNLLIQQSREPFLPEIITAFTRRYNTFKGIAEVTVTTAVEMDSASEQKIVQFVQQQSGNASVKINKRIDADIMGGFIVDFGDKIYDNSVRYKLQKIKKEIALN